MIDDRNASSSESSSSRLHAFDACTFAPFHSVPFPKGECFRYPKHKGNEKGNKKQKARDL